MATGARQVLVDHSDHFSACCSKCLAGLPGSKQNNLALVAALGESSNQFGQTSFGPALGPTAGVHKHDHHAVSAV
ncbi:MAG: hypothetical protein ACI91O_001284 [Candidatus Poriferisodalaceae bacterium]|jgi:hypothetical protein